MEENQTRALLDFLDAGPSCYHVAEQIKAMLEAAGFHALHALDDEPCRPFNKSKGIALGEGAGVLIVESYEHAKKRGEDLA